MTDGDSEEEAVDDNSVWQTNDDSDNEATTTAISSSYKVRGELTAEDGAGVLGRNRATSGDAPGVTGTTDSGDGYGLATPDDMLLEGTLDTNRTDFVVDAGTTADPSARNVVMGHASNTTDTDVVGATISGGGVNDADDTVLPNLVTEDGGTVGGGVGNRASGVSATVAGGRANVASGSRSTIAGGVDNDATKSKSTVAGGGNNTAGGVEAAVLGGNTNEALKSRAAVAGGENNAADGLSSVVVGGNNNDATGDLATIINGSGNDATAGLSTVIAGTNSVASGANSIAIGRKANTNQKAGAIVIADTSDTEITAQNSDEIRSQMPIYAPNLNTTSARAAKTDLEPVDPDSILSGLESLDIHTWELTEGTDDRHVGPMADEFHEAFDLAEEGHDEESIATVDADGVLFAAVQGLTERLEEVRGELETAQETIEERDERIDELEQRLAAVEQRLSDEE